MSIATTSILVPPVPASDVYNDGSIPHGAAQLTFAGKGSGGSDATYDTDDFSPAFPSNRVERTNRYGVPGGAFGVPKTPTGTCTVQIATASSYVPRTGDVFTADVTGSTSWYVTDVTAPFEKEQYQMVRLSYAQKLN